MNIFKKWFCKKPPNPVKIPEKNILANIAQFDNVWIKLDNNIFEGWVVERVNNTVYTVYSDSDNKLQDATFTISRPLNRTTLEQNNKVLILNKDDIVYD